MNDKYRAIILLAIARVMQLGQQVFDAHQDLERWYAEPLPTSQRVELGLKLQKAVNEQHSWLSAIQDIMESDE